MDQNESEQFIIELNTNLIIFKEFNDKNSQNNGALSLEE